MAATWKDIVDGAAQRTNEQLAGEIAGLTKLTQSEIDQIAPSPLDKANFAKLMDIVKDSTKDNDQKTQAVKNVDQFVSLLIMIAGKVA